MNPGADSISPALVNADSLITAEDCTMDAGRSRGFCMLAHGMTYLDRCTLSYGTGDMEMGCNLHVNQTREVLPGGDRGLFRFSNSTFKGNSFANYYGIYFDECSKEDETGAAAVLCVVI